MTYHYLFVGLDFRGALERLSPDRQWLLHEKYPGCASTPLDGGGSKPVHRSGGTLPAAWLPR